jgi:hypothetical protein
VAYVPPIGIPAPSFGIDDTPPADPGAWPGAEAAGFYYIDPTHGSATDANTYGYPNVPRLTIPNSSAIAAGSKVVVAAGYSITSDRNWICNGTEGSPVWIISEDAGNGWDGGAPTFTGSGGQIINFRGAYTIIKGCKFSNLRFRVGAAATAAHHMVIRDCEVTGYNVAGNTNIIGAGFAGNSSTPEADRTHDIVLYNNRVHTNGVLANFGTDDCHGTGFGSWCWTVWVLDSQYYGNAGDGIQHNSSNGSLSDIDDARLGFNIYNGRNVIHSNGQSGLWIKDARDVINSENEIYGHDDLNNSGGAGQGCGQQYGPERVWWICNNVHDNEGGIAINSDNSLNGSDVYVIGNRIVDNRYYISAETPPASQGGFNLAGVSCWDYANRYILFNTIWGNDAGINMATGAITRLEVYGNIIGGSRNTAGGACDILTEATPTTTVVEYNVLADNRIRINTGSVETLAQYQARTSDGENCTTSTPTFVDVDGRDMNLTSGDSVARNAGPSSAHAAFATFEGLYGLSIEADILGVARPQGANWDMGAYEFEAAVDTPSAGGHPTMAFLF